MKKQLFAAARKLSCAALAILMLLGVTGCAKIRDFFGRSDNTGETSGTAEVHPEGETTALSPEDSTSSPQNPNVPEIPDITFPEVTTAVLPLAWRDPLSAMLTAYDFSAVRPAMIAYENCNASCPQSGITSAPVLIEVPAANGQTILCALINNTAGLEGKTLYGPIAQANHNVLSVAEAFDAFLLCSGADSLAADEIDDAVTAGRRLNVIDALDGKFSSSGFWRDVDRINSFGYTHSMCVSANAISALPLLYGYETAYSAARGDLFSFYANAGTVPTGSSANHVIITYSQYQRVQLIYDTKNKVYVRYQFGDKAQVDEWNSSALSFSNVLILYAANGDGGETTLRLTGSGSGYFITCGKAAAIRWTRTDEASAFTFTLSSGRSFSFNPGKTMICVVPNAVNDAGGVRLDYNAKRDGALD